MEKISGLILDIYDDPGAEILKLAFPTEEHLPELVKHAHSITPEEREALPDGAFALILEQDGLELKKFATIDPGNTALSVEYFMKTGGRLPEEAQKVAAYNLCVACDWHGIEPPEELMKAAALHAGGYRLGRLAERMKNAHALIEYQKLAQGRGLGPGKGRGPFRGTGKGPGTGKCKKAMDKEAIGAMTAMMGALVMPGQISEAQKNLSAAKQLGMGKGRFVSPQQMKMQRMQTGTV